jgi:hypothetical protein
MVNIGILKEPWNWFVVAFSLALLLLVMHLFMRNTIHAYSPATNTSTQLKTQN